MTYGITGNILSKSDIGTYTYGQVNGQCASGFAGPHAVTSISGTKNTTYCYDANGNMTTGDGRIITYTAFDKPTRITKGGNTVEFFYGPDRKRFKRVDNTVENGTVTTIYAAGKAYERIENAQGVTAKHYIGDFAVLTQTINTGTVAVNYLHRDHLGSVETITNEAGIVTQRMSFDAWGKRREVNWQPMGEEAIATFNTDTTTRGFTGHEQIDTVGLIHMNGRVYDAELGRFLSADPHIQALDNLQNFNRYSYVLNNPLSYTDPTGFFFSKLFKAIGKAFGKIFKAIGRAFKKLLRSPIFRAIIQIVGCSFGAPACALISGAITAAAGGSLTDVLKAAAFGFLQVKVWTGVGSFLKAHGLATNFVAKGLVHGVVGGALSVAQGGNFLQGFVANAIGAVAGLAGLKAIAEDGIITQSDILAHTVIVAVAGCASAVVSGGKCANGAVTAAFANLHNLWHLVIRAGLLIGKATYVAAKAQFTYTLRSCQICPVEYVGRTSGGEATIDRILYGRWSGHEHSDLEVMEIDQWATGKHARVAIRGREQQLLDYYGGAKNDNPNTSLRNKIRAVGRRRAINYQTKLWKASNRRFGRLSGFNSGRGGFKWRRYP